MTTTTLTIWSSWPGATSTVSNPRPAPRPKGVHGAPTVGLLGPGSQFITWFLSEKENFVFSEMM